MTPDDRSPGGDDPPSGADEPGEGDDRPTGVVRALLELLAEMDERGERRRTGRWSNERTSVDYSVSIGSLDRALARGGDGEWMDSVGDESEQVDGVDDAGVDAVAVREREDGLLVVADLPGDREGDVSVEVDETAGTVVVAVDGVVGRIPLRDGDWTVADVSCNNDVLEVTLVDD